MHGTTHRASAACSWPAAATPSTWRSPPRWGPRLSRSSPSGLLRSKSRSRRQNQQIGSELTVAGAAHHMTDETIAPPAGRFTAATAGPSDAPLVILLHGYPQTRHTWRHQVPALGAAGYRAVAPDQRGYSAGVRPDPAKALAAYAIDRLVQDVLDLADAAGARGRPFHLVGHDWGGHVSWVTAHRHPERIQSLAILSRPHPAAFRRAFRENADDQQHRSRHHKAFHDPATGPRLLEDGARRLRARLAEQGVPAGAAAQHACGPGG